MEFFRKEFTAYGVVLKHSHCSRCQLGYRHAVALSYDPESCQRDTPANAKRAAIDGLLGEFNANPGLVACPACGEFPQEMVSFVKSRREEKAKRIRSFLFAVAVALALLALAVLIGNRPGIKPFIEPFVRRAFFRISRTELLILVTGSLASLVAAIIVACVAPWWVPRGDPNRHPRQARLEDAKQFAFRDGDAVSNESARIRDNAVAKLEVEIAKKRRWTARADFVLGLIIACLPLLILFFWRPAELAFYIAVAAACVGLALFGDVPLSWRLRNASFADLAETVARFDGPDENLSTKPWSRMILSAQRPLPGTQPGAE